MKCKCYDYNSALSNEAHFLFLLPVIVCKSEMNDVKQGTFPHEKLSKRFTFIVSQ